MMINVRLTSLYFPVTSLMTVYVSKPQMIPWVMEYVSGIRIMARKQGMASSSLSQLMFITGFIINTPTITSTGAVATAGTMESKGEKNMNGINSNPAITAVSPVRPPCATPEADSI